jgi:hypothetical protein
VCSEFGFGEEGEGNLEKQKQSEIEKVIGVVADVLSHVAWQKVMESLMDGDSS